MTSITVTIDGLDQAMAQLANTVTPRQQRKVLKKLGTEILKTARRRTKNQTDINGNAFVARKRAKKGKMLSKLTRAKNMNIIRVTDSSIKLGFRNRLVEQIAAKQQYGFKEHFTAAKMRARGSTAPEGSSSRRQAKALIELGYKVKRGNSNIKKTPSIKWITQNLSAGKAGIIIRALQGGAKTAWDTVLPARSFLGINATDNSHLNDVLLTETQKALEQVNA